MYDAIILAGGESSESLSRMGVEKYEALINIAGQPMVSFVVRALAKSTRVGSIFVLGPVEALSKLKFPPQVQVLAAGDTILETIALGMSALKHTNKVLVVTADIPLLTAEAVDDFIEQCVQKEADLYYPIVYKESNECSYPGNKRTYVRMKEGTVTGGNIFLVNPKIVKQCMQSAKPLIENRKNPFKLSQILGWSFVVKFLLGSLTIQEVEKRVSELLLIKGVAVNSNYPEIGLDVDKPSDLELVKTAFLINV